MPEWKPVLSKSDFVRRYGDNPISEFGNASPSWRNLDECLLDAGPGSYHIRNRIAGAETWYDVPLESLAQKWQEALSKYPADALYISAMCPTERTILQGEVMQTEHGLYLFYSRLAVPMREALRCAPEHAEATMANLLLRWAMCPNSYSWLQTLLDRYPLHVIEFTTLDCEWGSLKGFNTVFWETRLY